MRQKRVESVCCVNQTGAKRPFHLCCPACRSVMAAERLVQLIAEGTAPDECGPDVVRVAPARGRVTTYRPTISLPDGDGGHKLVDMGYRDRAAMVQEDVFDRMMDQARRRAGSQGAALPFTHHQIGAARDYRALHERLASAGVKCSRAFDPEPAGQGGVEFMVAYTRDSERMAMIHRAIGTGVALSVRRHAAHGMDRGSRRAILDRELVDMVCLRDMALSAVLKARGWAVKGSSVKALRAALCAALGRVQGV